LDRPLKIKNVAAKVAMTLLWLQSLVEGGSPVRITASMCIVVLLGVSIGIRVEDSAVVVPAQRRFL
jgi:hypothetical protein